MRECNNPVHLTVDTTLTNTTRMAIKAYVCVPLGVPNGKQGSMFTPVKVQVRHYQSNRGNDICNKLLNIYKKNSYIGIFIRIIVKLFHRLHAMNQRW